VNIAEHAYYVKLIRESSSVLEPLPVTLDDEWKALVPKKNTPALRGIRAVLFDLYGTLFISAAGEISAGTAEENTPLFCDEIKEMNEYFRQAVRFHHNKAKAEGIAWPEVRAEEIWAAYKGKIPEAWILPQRLRANSEKIGKRAALRCAGRELALRFELACNPVYPMPNAEQMLRKLAQDGIILGIISNAQFYTPLLFNAFFNAAPQEMGFDPELCIYSYEENEAKPSSALFAKALKYLTQCKIKPEEILYIGNDMKNDIVPAADAGFRTALFAGDRRSLRLRNDEPSCKGKKPAIVLENFAELV